MDNKENNNNIFYWIKMHKILTVCLAIIVYIVIPILPFIQSPIGIFSKEDATLFLSYYGTIISGVTGGALTLIGVIWTINYEKETRKEELAIKYKPFLQIKNKKINFCHTYNNVPICDIDEKNNILVTKDIVKRDSHFNGEIKLSNIGRGEIIEASISCTHIDTFLNLTLNEKISDIMPGDSFTFSFDISLKDYKNFLKEEYYGVKIRIKIIFFDFLNNKYSIEIPIYITNVSPSIQFEEQNDEDFIVYKNKIYYKIGEIIRLKKQ